jgi:uncharacterized protein (TIGR02646 family)
MREFDRSPPPIILTEIDLKSGKARWEYYGENYQQKRLESNHSFKFSWPNIDKKSLNHHLSPLLKAQTDEHCSYCDKFPLMKGDETIDHFKPKSNPDFYLLVCNWANLYIACKACQDAKMTKFSSHLLAPDAIEYEFLRYFIYNFREHKIEKNPRSTDIDQQKALTTIEIFDLNHPSQITSRRHCLERFQTSENPNLNDFNYRFMLN